MGVLLRQAALTPFGRADASWRFASFHAHSGEDGVFWELSRDEALPIARKHVARSRETFDRICAPVSRMSSLARPSPLNPRPRSAKTRCARTPPQKDGRLRKAGWGSTGTPWDSRDTILNSWHSACAAIVWPPCFCFGRLRGGNVPLRFCGASRRSWLQALAWRSGSWDQAYPITSLSGAMAGCRDFPLGGVSEGRDPEDTTS